MPNGRAPTAAALCLALAAASVGCGEDGGRPARETQPPPETRAETHEAPPPEAPSLPADLRSGLLIGYSEFRTEGGRTVPGAARLEILTRSGGAWHTEEIEDAGSNVFHKAMAFTAPGGAPGILTIGGMAAAVKLWHRGPGGWTAQTLWEQAFGGRVDRMRDVEVGDLFGDQRPAIAVATHDQGVVAVLRPPEGGGEGAWRVTELDRRPNTFIHEIELGDLDGDGRLEVYATPSAPNRLDGSEQRGEVVRYDPRAEGGARTVVAALGNRHAKEIWVGDVDGDGRDELYVAVEALTEGRDPNVRIVEPVEIRRYDHDTPPDQGRVIARIQDRLCRFLTVGDVDGDGRREMVASAFSSGVWLLRPGREAGAEWRVENIDRDSRGFEHASLLTDLDGDGTDELYVMSDRDGELRRYTWSGGAPRREVIQRRESSGSRITWNLMPFPRALLAGPRGSPAPRRATP